MRTTRLKAYAAGLAAMVALTGCSSSDGGTAAPPRTEVVTGAPTAAASTTAAATATTTAAEDPVLARIPAAARPETTDGATEFVLFYFETMNEAFVNADSRLLTKLGLPECKMCVAMVGGVDDAARKGHHYSANLVNARNPRPAVFNGEERIVLVDVVQQKVDVLDGDGKPVDSVDGGTGRYMFTLAFEERWYVERIQKVSE